MKGGLLDMKIIGIIGSPRKLKGNTGRLNMNIGKKGMDYDNINPL